MFDSHVCSACTRLKVFVLVLALEIYPRVIARFKWCFGWRFSYLCVTLACSIYRSYGSSDMHTFLYLM